MSKIYKYMSPGLVDSFFNAANHTTSIKVSQLRDYNDPYEFFLTIDYNQSPHLLAYYQEIIATVTGKYVSCFSKSPVITPMWAHYASNSTGFALEFDEAALEKWIEENTQEPSCSFDDIHYYDTPNESLLRYLQRAYTTCKFRHIAMLREVVGGTAYFSKQLCWSYEQERRMLINESAIRKISDSLYLLSVPAETITAVIAGTSMLDEDQRKLETFAQLNNCKFYRKKIGKSSTNPFLVDESGKTYVFDESKITSVENQCRLCKEPTEAKANSCPWCQITEAHEKNAAGRNSLRALQHAGMLRDYLDGFGDIQKNSRSRDE
ncbi:hypothetical protein QE393_001619 [Pseudomonas sp. SORGH_AS 211]|uniref:DUF2971 domain-containing protein n=1 Tax=Pseudomonas sp. SORGH_AS_0211 TaxID=3041796 RepID=UPI0028667830|nr:DUF2971 domain-containing protein [Pseudomonas sp. SORGH_AS_0211]MDR6178359.1 hypothetical protein [Pseudomonas sp. SORGH_AS_0211]